jgi:hypothetical protein
MAYEYHRRQEFDKALPLYEELARDANLRTVASALLAHCYIHQRRYKEAIQAWNAADVGKHHTQIDFAIHEVFSKRSPYARQSDLVDQVRNGEKELIRELLLLGIEWDTDWWNRNLNREALAIDIEIIEETFGKQSVEATESRLLVNAIEIADSGDQQAIEGLLQSAGYIVNKQLPSSSFIARRLIALVISNEIRTTQQLEAELGPELMQRVQLHDRDAMDIMASLYEANGNQPELSKIDSIGWHVFHDPTYALSYLHGLVQNQNPFRDEMASAVTDFPDDSRILYMFYDHTRDEEGSDRAELLSRIIEKEYFGLRNDPSRYGYALRSFYTELEKLIK